MYITIKTIPKADVDEFIRIIGKCDPIRFFSLLLQFGEAITKELRSGSIFTAGTHFRGYRKIDITLSRSPKEITNIGWEGEIILSDVPDAQRLRILMRQTGMNDPARLIDRFVYWLSLISHVEWMEYTVFMMNAKEERWERFCFSAFNDLRKEFSY